MFAELLKLLSRRAEATRALAAIASQLQAAAHAAMDDTSLDDPKRRALVELRGALAANNPGEVDRIAAHLLRAAANAEVGEANNGR